MHYLIFFLPNLLLVIDCALHRRDLSWFFVLGLLGPLGAIAYLVYFRESITFPFPLARLLAGPKTQRKCPQCGRWANQLFPFTDGRQERTICSICRDHLASSR